MPTILYIEDTEDNRILVCRKLERAGFEVRTADDAEQGFALISRERPDLILLDMGLPGLDGWTAATRLKSDVQTDQIPIIALTAHAMAEERDQALNAGCDDYESKPFNFDSLLHKIQALLPPNTGQQPG